jgi:hypothetical protein
MTVFLYLVGINPERTVGIQNEVHEVSSRGSDMRRRSAYASLHVD